MNVVWTKDEETDVYNTNEIRGIFLTENLLLYSDGEGGDSVLHVCERSETTLKRKFKITGLSTPRGVAVDEYHIYLVDSVNNRILTFDMNGRLDQKLKCSFLLPRGIAVTPEWIFVCDTDNNRIVILDKSFKRGFEIINKSILESPHDIACLCNSDMPQQYNLYISTSGGKIIEVNIFLDNTQPPKIQDMHIISEKHMGIKLQPRHKNLRSICIVKKRFIYVTEMCDDGRLICLDLHKGGRCVYTLKMKSSKKCRPTIVTHCGDTIAYTEWIPKENRSQGFFIYFFKHDTVYPSVEISIYPKTSQLKNIIVTKKQEKLYFL